MLNLKLFGRILLAYFLGLFASFLAAAFSIFTYFPTLTIGSCELNPNFRHFCSDVVSGEAVWLLLVYGIVTVTALYFLLKNTSAKRSYKVFFEVAYIIGLYLIETAILPGGIISIFASIFLSYYISRNVMMKNLDKQKKLQRQHRKMTAK